MIREAYDLDMICYFPHDDISAGKTLKDIYQHARDALAAQYWIEAKPSALRLKDLDPKNFKVDFHIDVVPGRYIDDEKADAFLYQSSGEKGFLKTNLEKHISYVRDSGLVDTIRLMKLWRARNHINIKNFALELLTIDLLEYRKRSSLTNQLEYVWQEFRDHSADLKVEDPANPNCEPPLHP